MEVEIWLDSFSKIYFVGEIITGKVIITSREKYNEMQYLNMTWSGSYTIKNNKVQPAAISHVKFYNKTLKIQDSGKIVLGMNTIPFRFPLVEENDSNLNFYESYHGVLVSLSYEWICELKTSRSSFTSDKTKLTINVPGMGIQESFGRKRVPYNFTITPETVEMNRLNNWEKPKFKVECHIDSINCDINKGFDGYCIVHECNLPIKSVELQFIRSEQIYLDKLTVLNETSEIQNLQIGDGDVNKGMEIPLFMLFPKIFSCANLNTNLAKISFEMNIMIVWVNGLVIVENFPVNLWRS